MEKHNISSSKSSISESISVCEYDEFINSFVKGLDNIKKLRGTLQAKLLQVKFEEIMLYLVETKGTDFLEFMMSTQDPQSRTLKQVAENNSLNKLTLKELAFLSNMSVSTFKREFEKHFNESPIKWFQDKRLTHAAFLLREQSKRPSDIFVEIGYENLSNFINAFKAKFGLTPKQYQAGN